MVKPEPAAGIEIEIKVPRKLFRTIAIGDRLFYPESGVLTLREIQLRVFFPAI